MRTIRHGPFCHNWLGRAVPISYETMPTYVYECSSCKNTFEVEQRITEDPLDTCKCGSTGSVKRVIQPVAVSFKGSGFHINDYSPSAKPEAVESAPKAECTGDTSTCACSQPATED